jgi:predicted deacetylase
MRARLVVSVHDVAPASRQASERWLAELDRLGVPSSILVIPGRWRGRSLAEDSELASMLADRVVSGDEIVQHGWRHGVGADGNGWRTMTERALARGAGEFAALSVPAATLRLRAGRAELTAAGLKTAGFTAPGWLHSPGTLQALRQEGYSFTTTHAGLVVLATGRRLPGPAFSHRAGGFGEALAGQLIWRGSRTVARRGGLVRIALHPDEINRPRLREQTRRAIGSALDAGAQPTTYGRLAGCAPADAGSPAAPGR